MTITFSTLLLVESERFKDVLRVENSIRCRPYQMVFFMVLNVFFLNILQTFTFFLSMYILELDFCVFTKLEQQLREFNRKSNMSLPISHIIVDQISFQGTKNPLKFASLLTCGFVPQLVDSMSQLHTYFSFIRYDFTPNLKKKPSCNVKNL